MDEHDLAWELQEFDTFDRETPPKVRAKGTGLLDGARALWSLVLTEGISQRGQKSFSEFRLCWTRLGQPASSSVPVEVEGNAELLKLREWVKADESVGGDLLSRISALHARLVRASPRWRLGGGDAHEEARKLLLRVRSLASPILL